MKITGTTTMGSPMDQVWEAFLTPEVLIQTIPGCESLEEIGEHEYLATVRIGVGSIKGAYQGKIKLSDLKKHESLKLNASAASPTGTIEVEVDVAFTNLGDSSQIDYDADAVVGGMIGGVGQRMLSSVSKRMANQFFANVDKVIQTGGAAEAPAAAATAPTPPTAAPAPPTAAPGLRTVTAAPTSSSSQKELATGFIAGALTALLGVLVGAFLARRR